MNTLAHLAPAPVGRVAVPWCSAAWSVSSFLGDLHWRNGPDWLSLNCHAMDPLTIPFHLTTLLAIHDPSDHPLSSRLETKSWMNSWHCTVQDWRARFWCYRQASKLIYWLKGVLPISHTAELASESSLGECRGTVPSTRCVHPSIVSHGYGYRPPTLEVVDAVGRLQCRCHARYPQ